MSWSRGSTNFSSVCRLRIKHDLLPYQMQGLLILTGFVMMAVLAGHDKKAVDRQFDAFIPPKHIPPCPGRRISH